MEKELRIKIPSGYEIDKENSTFECIKFKKIVDKTLYVDLALPSGTLWATTNVGAEEETDYGDYLNFEEACKYNLPTREQMEELRRCCTWKWVKVKDKPGYLVIGRNGCGIFLPAAGWRSCSEYTYNMRSIGNYWSSSPSDSEKALDLEFGPGGVYMFSNFRCNRRSARKVLNIPNNTYEV